MTTHEGMSLILMKLQTYNLFRANRLADGVIKLVPAEGELCAFAATFSSWKVK